jgi:hypothetical protein
MHNPERSIAKQGSIPGRIGNLLFQFWHGYSKEDSDQFAYWRSVDELLKVDGKAVDRDWIHARESQLNAQFAGKVASSQREILAYGRARLEDYCRHQGVLDDGRVVTRVPAYGTSRDELARIGILADNFSREYIHESSGQDYTVILPAGWSMRPVYEPADGEEFQLDTSNCERFAAIYDQTENQVVSIFYNAKPFPYDDGFRSGSRVLGASA